MTGDHGASSPIDPSRAAYVYMQMADHIAALIQSGDLPAGARLAGEQDLADEYGVALGTARRAVRELRDRGLVVTLPAKGTYVTEHPSGTDSAGT